MIPEFLFDSECVDKISFELKIEFICEKLSLDLSTLDDIKESVNNIMLSDIDFEDVNLISLMKDLISENNDISPDFIKIYNSEELYKLKGFEYIDNVYLLCYDFFKEIQSDDTISETINNVIDGCGNLSNPSDVSYSLFDPKK